MEYCFAEIRRLIDGALSLGQLDDLLSDYFRSVYKSTENQERAIKTRKLIDESENTEKFLKLLGEIENINPKVYKEFEGKLYEKEIEITNLPELRKALISAYPTVSALKKMLGEQMGKDLKKIAGSGEIDELVFSLVEWAQTCDRLEELLVAARLGNPNHEGLKQNFDCPSESPMLAALSPYLEQQTAIDANLGEVWRQLVPLLDAIDSKILKSAYRWLFSQENSSFRSDLWQQQNPITALKDMFLTADLGDTKLLKYGQLLANCQEIGDDQRQKLRDWLGQSAKKLGIEPPELGWLPLAGTLQTYLLIAIWPESKGYRIQAEFIRDYRENFRSEPIDLIEHIRENCKNSSLAQEIEGKGKGITCNTFAEIGEKIKSLISLVEGDTLLLSNILDQGNDYNFKIELFLGHQHFEKDLNEWKARGNYDDEICIFCKHNLSIRSLERAIRPDLENSLKQRWDEWQKKIDDNNSIFEGFQSPLDAQKKWTYAKLSTELKKNKKIGYKVKPFLPKSKAERQAIFQALLNSGILVCFWLSDRTPQEIDLETTIDPYLKVDYCKDNFTPLIEAMWELRGEAHAQNAQDVQQHIGYHLGFLCDNPYRLPQNHPLIEFGL